MLEVVIGVLGFAVYGFFILLIWQLSFWWFMPYLVLSLLTFIVYGHDKRSAQLNTRRIPERVLHGLALSGGWPGALLAQHQFRHKTQKQPFKAILWSTIIVNATSFTAFCWFFGQAI